MGVDENISVIYPTTDINATQDEFFNVSLNITCLAGDCGTINVSLDPRTVLGAVADEQVNNQIEEDNLEADSKSFFKRVIEFVLRVSRKFYKF